MSTIASPADIRADFDLISELTPVRDRLGWHEKWLLKHLPQTRGVVLEIGCGVGQLSRMLAETFQKVMAIDFSEGMIAQAKARSIEHSNIEFACAELFEWLADSRRYDCVVTVSTLHHVELSSALRCMALALQPGGRLLVLDLVDRNGWDSIPVNAVAWVAGRAGQLVLGGSRSSPELLHAYNRHGARETYATLREVQRIAARELPGARVRGHLFWRYSIVWEKPFA